MSDLDPIRDGRHYDALKAQNDGAFYLAQAQAASPVLEIGCGTGRVTIPLAAAGVDITGLDVSASMLQEPGARPSARASASPGLKPTAATSIFALIIMPFNTLQFFRDTAALGPLRQEPPWGQRAVCFRRL
jgi:SAM-dependent methyltransferase